MYLFDTDIISNLIGRAPSTPLLRRLAQVAAAHQHTSAVTVGELFYGAHRSGRPEHFLRLLEERVWPHVRILPFDVPAAQVYGRLRADLERAGVALGEPDLRIAAIALAHSLVVVTGNVRHFSRVPGLPVENWLET